MNFQNYFTLSNGMQLPCMGFGTYNPDKGADNKRIILDAIDAGYRYFDTASLYETERDLGNAIIESGIDRKDLIIATKVWIDEMGYEETLAAFDRSLNRLQMDYVDFYLIHWPRQNEKDTDWKERDRETYRAMCELKKQGKIKGLGLSNFLPHHLDPLWDAFEEKPLVDQLELHIGHSQENAVNYCKEHDILVQAWSPLGRNKVLNNEIIKDIASKYGRPVAELCIRYLLQKGIFPIVKSSTKERMLSNMKILEFELKKEDMQILDCMPQTLWLGEHPDFSIPKKASNLNQ